MCFKGNALLLLLVALLRGAPLNAARYRTGAREARIIGGQPALDDMPHIVSLITYGIHICGGSIINERTVLTAAHCVAYVRPATLQVHAGTKLLRLREGQLVPVRARHYHPLWSADTMDYDVGLVRLVRALSFGATIQPIPLADASYTPQLVAGTLATVAGWGYTSIDGPESQQLRYARVPLIEQDSCRALLQELLTDRMLCAGYEHGAIDACQMDSGGPLTLDGRLIGIVSWGIGCALPDKPGVYTRVAEILPWVREQLEERYSEDI